MQRFAAAWSIALLLIAAPSAQQARFKSGVDLVTVDVAVLNGAGQPISDLTAEDFELSVDGVKRRIVWTEFVPHRSAAPASITADHFSSNEGLNSGRLVLIAVDQAHIRRVEGLAALRASAAFLDTLDRDDRLAVTSLNESAEIHFSADHVTPKRRLQQLTGTATAMPTHFRLGLSEALAIADGSRTRLDQAVVRECGEKLAHYENLRRLAEADGVRDPCPVQVEQEARALAQHARTEARLTLDGLRRLIDRLAGIDGPKTLVVLSEGLVAEPQLVDLTTLGLAAHAARVTIYVLQLETPILDASTDTVSPTLYPDLQLRADGLARLAGSGRGAMFRLVGSDPLPFRRILSELSGHYLLAFEATDADRTRGAGRLAVTARGAAIVRARPTFTIPSHTSSTTKEAELVRLLRDPRLATDVPVRVATYSYRRTAGEGYTTIVATEIGREEDVTFGYVIVNQSGVIAASGGDIAARGRFVVTATLPPGGYMLKAAVIDNAARRGSVDRHFEVRLGKAGSTTFGDLMIAEPGPGSEAESAMHPVVASLRGKELVVFTELYGPDNWIPAPGTVKLEIVSDGGTSESVAPMTPSIQRVGAGRWTVTARSPVDAAPGDTRFVRATISIPGHEPARLTRAFTLERAR